MSASQSKGAPKGVSDLLQSPDLEKGGASTISSFDQHRQEGAPVVSSTSEVNQPLPKLAQKPLLGTTMSASQSRDASRDVTSLVQSPDAGKGSASTIGGAPASPSISAVNQPTKLTQKHYLNKQGEVTNKYWRFSRLCEAIIHGLEKDVSFFLDEYTDAATVEVDVDGSTALHLACITGQANIVDLLLPRMSDDLLACTDAHGRTALQLAAISGNVEIARRLAERNLSLLGEKGGRAEIPVVLAAKYDNYKITYYLYYKTPPSILLQDGGEQGTLLLSYLINPEMLDLAYVLIQWTPALCVAKSDRGNPLRILSTMPALFLSGSNMGHFKRFIYDRIELSEREMFFSDDPNIAAAQGGSLEPMNSSDPLQRIVFYLYKISGIHEIRRLKLMRFCSENLLKGMSRQVSRLSFEDRLNCGVKEAIFSAVKYGVPKLVHEIIKWNPDMIWVKHPETGVHLIQNAVEWRQGEVFRLLLGYDSRKKKLLKFSDNKGNNIMHLAGTLPHPSKLERISGAGLRMQSELQWFKEVELIASDVMKQRINSDGKTPQETFSDAHADLRKEAEKWMKDTAQSYSTASVLIVTIMFAVAFTLPGGNEENTGYPIHIRDTQFVVFLASDIISFFAASTSLLVFLGILTARHAEDDYFWYLPLAMMVGLSMLFVSIVAMMVSFSSGLLTSVRQHSWTILPIIYLATTPVVLFVVVQYPLLVEMVTSTCRSLALARKTSLPL